METTSMMSTLLTIPLFQGLTTDELMRLLERVRPDFLHYCDVPIVRQGERHTRLLFVLHGKVLRSMQLPDVPLCFTEELGEPGIIELCSLFGRTTTLPASYYAEGDVTLLAFDKTVLFNTFGHFDIIQLNLLNILCAYTQSYTQKQMSLPSGENIPQRFCRLIDNLSSNPMGEKRLDITRITLAGLLDCNRRIMSQQLVEWEKAGLIRLSYGGIEIPDYQIVSQTARK